jgi:uncharacterized membrane protein YecN with MAPEG domain
MTVAVVCVAMMAALVFLLGLLVSLRRLSSGVIFHGAPPDPSSSLTKAQRAHGNATEWVPVLAVLMLYLGSQPQPAWLPWLMVLLAASRWLVALGFLTCASLERVHPLKAVGATLTYIGGLALCAAAVMTVL